MKRTAYFDNAKLLLIFLVVFGHMIQPFTMESNGVNTLYLWVYTYSMPAFIFLAGFFAKGSGDKKYMINLARKLLLPYLTFQILYSGYYLMMGRSSWQTGIFSPHWSLWFLFSLFSWHILLVLFKRIPPVIGISLAVLMGLGIGYIDDVGNTFSLSRTFAFFPFFLTGYWLTKDQVMLVKHRAVKMTGIFAMGMIALLIYMAPDINSGWLLASKSYVDLGVPVFGGIARLLVYLTSTIMAISVLAWIPNNSFKVTPLGARTLYVYLLHGFFIQFFREANLFKVDHLLDIFGLGILSAVIAFILSSRPIMFIWEPFIEGSVSYVRKLLHRLDRS